MTFESIALTYAAKLGWYLFPLKPHTKEPITTHGVKDAVNTAEGVQSFWQKYPSANIGVSCGASNLAVIDLDSPQAIDRWYLTLAAFDLSNLITAIVATSKGEHWYFRQPSKLKITNTQKGRDKNGQVEIDKIERRGVGGYVVLPPSIHPSGVQYRWKQGLDPFSVEMPELPFELALAIQPPRVAPVPVPIPPLPRANGEAERHAQNIVKKTARELAQTPKGAWHEEILKAARKVGGLVGAGLVEEQWTLETLLSATSARQDRRDSEHTLRQSLEFGKKFPYMPEAKR